MPDLFPSKAGSKVRSWISARAVVFRVRLRGTIRAIQEIHLLDLPENILPCNWQGGAAGGCFIIIESCEYGVSLKRRSSISLRRDLIDQLPRLMPRCANFKQQASTFPRDFEDTTLDESCCLLLYQSGDVERIRIIIFNGRLWSVKWNYYFIPFRLVL